jgi:hypothetical protein
MHQVTHVGFPICRFQSVARGVLHPTNNLNIAVPQRDFQEGKIQNLTKLRVLCFCFCGGVNRNRRFTRSNLSSNLPNFETTRTKMMDRVDSRTRGVGQLPDRSILPVNGGGTIGLSRNMCAYVRMSFYDWLRTNQDAVIKATLEGVASHGSRNWQIPFSSQQSLFTPPS